MRVPQELKPAAWGAVAGASADASANLAELKKASTWQRGDFIIKGGWAKMPGASSADSSVANACAEMLIA